MSTYLTFLRWGHISLTRVARLSSAGRALIATCSFCLMMFSPQVCRGQLSANSGINGADTWVTFDLTMQSQSTLSSASPLYNPATQTTSNTLPSPVDTETYHVEIGYDTSSQVVVNLWPAGAGADPDSTGWVGSA